MNATPYHTETVQSAAYPGWTYKVEHWPDNDADPPWERDCSCVEVTERRGTNYCGHFAKAPGEVIIQSDHGYCRVVDFAAEVKRARKEGWGLSDSATFELKRKVSNKQILKTMTMTERMDLTNDQRIEMINAVVLTPGQIAAEAVQYNIDRIKGWLENRWHYCGLVVKVVSAPEGIDFDPDDEESCWGFEDDDSAYLEEQARGMGEALIERFLKAHAAALESEAKRAAEVVRTRTALKPVTVQELGVFLDVPDNAAVRADGWVQAWVFAPAAVGDAL